MKRFADDNFKFHENSSKFSKRVENTVGKGEMARYEPFLLFSHCFQKASFPGVSKGVIVWEWVNTTFSKDYYFTVDDKHGLIWGGKNEKKLTYENMLTKQWFHLG